MRLTVKLLLWFLACVALGLGTNAFLAVRAERARYEVSLADQHAVTGRVLRSAFEEVMAKEGEARAVSVLASSDKGVRHIDLRWVYLDDNAPIERRPGVPVEDVAAVTRDDVIHVEAEGRLRSYVRVHVDGRPDSALEISESLEGERAIVRRMVLHEARAVGLVALAIGVVASIVGALVVARPMQRLVEHARRIGRGDLSPALVAPTRDEISALAHEMNAMCTELTTARSATMKALEQLRHAERLTTVGKLASGIAHELGTPLNVISLRAKSIARAAGADPAAQESARSIVEQATRMTELVRRLLDFARRKAPKSERVAPGAVVRRAARLVEPIAAKANVAIRIVPDEEPPDAVGDAAQLEQVLTNLYINAIQAMPTGGEVTVTIARSSATPPADLEARDGGYVRIAVRDEGTGIPADVLPHIFEPFFTTKDIGAGTGLGLAVCYGIVKDHGGFIDVRADLPRGVELGVNLPEAAS